MKKKIEYVYSTEELKNILNNLEASTDVQPSEISSCKLEFITETRGKIIDNDNITPAGEFIVGVKLIKEFKG